MYGIDKEQIWMFLAHSTPSGVKIYQKNTRVAELYKAVCEYHSS